MNIAISGPMCSGKTTTANLLKLINNDFKIYSFGQKIKDIAHELFNMDKNFKDRSLLIKYVSNLNPNDSQKSFHIFKLYLFRRRTSGVF